MSRDSVAPPLKASTLVGGVSYVGTFEKSPSNGYCGGADKKEEDVLVAKLLSTQGGGGCGRRDDTVERGDVEVQSEHDRLLKRILDQTAAFLAYEIEPILIAEYLKLRRKLNKKSPLRSVPPLTSLSTGCLNNQEVVNFLSLIIRDTGSDDYRLFCDILHRLDTDCYTADFLDSLGLWFKLLVPFCSTGSELLGQNSHLTRCVPDVYCACGCYKNSGDDESSQHRREEEEVNGGKYFDIEIQYADQETRVAQEFTDVVVLKRRKQRRSQLTAVSSSPINDVTNTDEGECPTARTPVIVLHDSSDRYVPVMSVQLYDQCLCDRRMRRMERILDQSTCVRDLRLVRARFDVPALVRLGRSLERIHGLYQLDVRSVHGIISL